MFTGVPSLSPSLPLPLPPRFPSVQFNLLHTDRRALLSERLEQAKFFQGNCWVFYRLTYHFGHALPVISNLSNCSWGFAFWMNTSNIKPEKVIWFLKRKITYLEGLNTTTRTVARKNWILLLFGNIPHDDEKRKPYTRSLQNRSTENLPKYFHVHPIIACAQMKLIPG